MFQSLIEAFALAAATHPNKPAILFHNQIITYQELEQRSNDLALHLIQLDVTPEQIIPLILERDPQTIISMLAVLKAGCAFLPISPITPCSRINFILQDTKAKLIISNKNLDHLELEAIQLIDPNTIKHTGQMTTISLTENQMAYVMYTSGSTGNPKGVIIEHVSVMNLFSSLIYELDIKAEDLILALTDYTFDISLIELLMPLLKGATILLTEQGTVADGVKIRHYLQNYLITLMQATPLTWEILLKQGWKNEGAMKILVGGEKFKTQLALLLDYKKENVWNMYGPTETCMWSMFNPIHNTLTTDSVPLGIPLKNTTIHIYDENLNQVDLGIQGELYIGGDGLARGYLNNQKLTEERFIYHPRTAERLYKTGDLAIMKSISEICYVGRVDDQLKFGGIRIEAGEIESVIEQEPFVKKAVVKVHETEGYYKSLAAYIEVDEEKIFSGEIHASGSDVSCFLKSIYDETYSHAEDFENGSINNCGWQNSFTGQLFSVKELSESYQFIRKLISEADLSDVLEVGCGAGSLLFEYIENAGECTIVELSSKAIEYVQHKLTEQQQSKVIFKNESAINIHIHKKFSCVIVNSVIQYFPSIQMLITTLNQLVTATKSQGTIIIGDVRSLELIDCYLLEKIRTNSDNQEEVNFNLNSFYYKSRDAEIALSPKFFYALKNINPEISHVDISVKHGHYKNELNYFRYDVILHVNKITDYQTPLSIDYTPELNVDLIHKLAKENNKILVVSKIPNVHIQSMIEIIDRDIPNHLPLCPSEPKAHHNSGIKQQIYGLLALNIDGYEQFVKYNENNPMGKLDVYFYPKGRTLIRDIDSSIHENYRTYCREPFNPWLQKFCFDHIKLKVSQHVVSWVNPSVYVWIEKWPLSINGKLDKKRLKLPVNCDTLSTEDGTLSKLQTIWRNITGDNALTDKEFWVHGISSLCMYFFLATINETFLVSINYHEFREYNTLDKLSDYIEQLLDIIPSE